jgi:hypothetical protein
MGRQFTRHELMFEIWDLQFDGLSQKEIRERMGMSEDVYRDVRSEAVVSFDPTPEQLRRLQIRAQASPSSHRADYESQRYGESPNSE